MTYHYQPNSLSLRTFSSFLSGAVAGAEVALWVVVNVEYLPLLESVVVTVGDAVFVRIFVYVHVRLVVYYHRLEYRHDGKFGRESIFQPGDCVGRRRRRIHDWSHYRAALNPVFATAFHSIHSRFPGSFTVVFRALFFLFLFFLLYELQ